MTTTSHEVAAPLTLGALQVYYRSRSAIEFFEMFQCPLLVHESEPESARDADVSFRTLITSNELIRVTSRSREVFPIRKFVPARNPFEAMITLGRAPNNDVVLACERISKFHAYVATDSIAKQSVLIDAGSANGTWLDGKKIERGVREIIAPQRSGQDGI